MGCVKPSRMTDLAHAIPLGPAPRRASERRRPGTTQCPECGRWIGDPKRSHKSPTGDRCKVVEPVVLDELPPVNLPPEPKYSQPGYRTPEERPGVRVAGECETCGAFVTGERRFCGLCLARREERKR